MQLFFTDSILNAVGENNNPLENVRIPSQPPSHRPGSYDGSGDQEATGNYPKISKCTECFYSKCTLTIRYPDFDGKKLNFESSYYWSTMSHDLLSSFFQLTYHLRNEKILVCVKNS